MSHNVLPTKKRRNPNSQELGLRIANIFGRYLLKSDHLHYGFWPDNLPVTLANLPKAQELYAQFLRENIPGSVSEPGWSLGWCCSGTSSETKQPAST